MVIRFRRQQSFYRLYSLYMWVAGVVWERQANESAGEHGG
jgi:hypothetical protein